MLLPTSLLILLTITSFISHICSCFEDLGGTRNCQGSGDSSCNGNDYSCDDETCAVTCASGNSCLDMYLLCNSTSNTSTCSVTCTNSNACMNFTLVSYAATTSITCSGSTSCINVDYRNYGDNDDDYSDNSLYSSTLDCSNREACSNMYYLCNDNMGSCTLTCESQESCNNGTFECYASDTCLFDWATLQSCENTCNYICLNEDNCQCVDSNEDTCNTTQVAITFNADGNTVGDDGSGSGSGSGSSSSGGGTVAGPDAVLYNLVFALIFAILFGYCVFKLITLIRASFYDDHTLLSIIPMLCLITFWQFFVSFMLGVTETYMSDADFLSGVFICALSIPIHLYIILLIMYVLLFHSKYCTKEHEKEAQSLTFLPALSTVVECLKNSSFVAKFGHYNFVLIQLFVIFLIWMIMSMVLSGNNEGNLLFNGIMVLVYALLGLLLSVTIFVSYIQLRGAQPDTNKDEDMAKESLFGMILGICAFFMFLLYIIAAFTVATDGGDAVRITLLIFEILAIIMVILSFPYYNTADLLNDTVTKQVSINVIRSVSPSNPTSPALSPFPGKGTAAIYDASKDPKASLFEMKHLSQLIEDKMEYCEILSKSCTLQSEDLWYPAKITDINPETGTIDIQYTDDKKNIANKLNHKTEMIDLNNPNDAARFRVHLFGNPEPHKLPATNQFGIPDILYGLLSKLLSPKIAGDKEHGIFRVSAQGTKLAHYKTAICQYKLEEYDYRQGIDFEDPKDKENAFDVHCLSALIKDWIRQFPETIVKIEHSGLVGFKSGSPNDELKDNLLKWITFVIVYLAKEENGNKMTEKSLAIVFGPNMLGDDLPPSDQLILATNLNKQFEQHCVEKRGTDNPVEKWAQSLE